MREVTVSTNNGQVLDNGGQPRPRHAGVARVQFRDVHNCVLTHIHTYLHNITIPITYTRTIQIHHTPYTKHHTPYACHCIIRVAASNQCGFVFSKSSVKVINTNSRSHAPFPAHYVQLKISHTHTHTHTRTHTQTRTPVPRRRVSATMRPARRPAILRHLLVLQQVVASNIYINITNDNSSIDQWRQC